jgi:hypothetical protein
MAEERNAYVNLTAKPDEKKQLGRPRRRWEYTLKYTRVITCDGRENFGLLWLRIGSHSGLL